MRPLSNKGVEDVIVRNIEAFAPVPTGRHGHTGRPCPEQPASNAATVITTLEQVATTDVLPEVEDVHVLQPCPPTTGGPSP